MKSWVFLICFLVSCIILHLTGWNLIPHFLAQEPNRSISLWSFIVFFILNFTIANSHQQKVLFQTQYLMRCHLCTERITRDQERCPWDTRQNWSPVRFCSIYNNSSLSEAKKRIYPFQCLATDSIAKQFAFEEFMRRCISISKILAQSFITVVNWVSQLFPFLNACCLSDRSLYSSRWAMIFEHTMTVRVTCKVHKSRKPGDNCTQVTCHSSWKGGRYLQETIPLGFHQCQLIAEKDEQIPDLTLLLAPLGP